MEQQYDIIFLDEFHRAGAPIWNEYVLTLLENNPDAIVIGTTATHIRYLDNERDMAQELFDSDIAKVINLRDAILRDILPYPEYYTCGYKIEQMVYEAEQKLINGALKKDEDYLYELLDKLKRQVQKAGGVREFFDKYLTKRTGHYIVFCNNYEHLQEVKEQLPEWFGDTELSVYELYSENDNRGVTRAFENDKSEKLHLLLSIDMLNEGRHIKGISGVIMMRSTQSMNVYMQQVGRAFSASFESVPKIYDLVDNAAMLKPIKGFWKETAKEYRRIHPGCMDKYEIEDDDYRFHIEKKDLEFLDVLDEFYANLYMSWDDWYKLVEEYYEEHGELLVPQNYSVNGYNLGAWICHQRSNYKKGNLSPDKIEKLEAIGMIWDLFEARWQEGYRYAKGYFEKNGHLNVPMECLVDGYNIGNWIRHQKNAYKSGTLSNSRIEKLEVIGIVWDVEELQWQKGYHYAKEYFKENGHLKFQRDFSIDGYNLSAWIARQKRIYNQGRLSASRIEKLEAIGIIWDVKETQWQENYFYASEYFEKNGHLNIPNKFSVDGYKLGVWISNQRRAYNQGKLSASRIEKLEAIGIIWDVKEAQWRENYCLAKKYFQEYGDLIILYNYIVNGCNIGKWIYAQRSAYKKGTLSTDRIQELESIGMIWDVKEAQWQENYFYASEYFEKNGQLNIPTTYSVDGYKLGVWIATQRQAYKQRKLSANRIEKLEIIGMVWDTFEIQWQNGYHYAREYFEKNGHLNVPNKYSVDGYELGAWIRNQRQAYKKDKLSTDKIRKLESIGMDWDPIENQWQENYKLAEYYYQEHGDLLIPRSYSVDGCKIGIWVHSQRIAYKKGILSTDHIQKLEAISMVWEVEK